MVAERKKAREVAALPEFVPDPVATESLRAFRATKGTAVVAPSDDGDGDEVVDSSSRRRGAGIAKVSGVEPLSSLSSWRPESPKLAKLELASSGGNGVSALPAHHGSALIAQMEAAYRQGKTVEVATTATGSGGSSSGDGGRQLAAAFEAIPGGPVAAFGSSASRQTTPPRAARARSPIWKAATASFSPVAAYTPMVYSGAGAVGASLSSGARAKSPVPDWKRQLEAVAR